MWSLSTSRASRSVASRSVASRSVTTGNAGTGRSGILVLDEAARSGMRAPAKSMGNTMAG